MTAPLVLLVDGALAGDMPAHIDNFNDLSPETATLIARRVSRAYPHLPVALCRLGDARTLRRFEAGREVLP